MRAWVDLLTASGRLIEVRRGCPHPGIERAQVELGVTFPEQLASFLRSTNGFADIASHYDSAWTLGTIVTENRRAWADAAMPLDDHLRTFGDDGAGDWFCLSLAPPDEDAIFHWGWIEGSAHRIADSLITFWPSWLDGSVKV